MADINKKEPKDSIVNVSVLPNNTEAYIFVIPPENGGKPVTKDMIMSELQKNKVVYGLREDVIDSIVSDSRYNENFALRQLHIPSTVKTELSSTAIQKKPTTLLLKMSSDLLIIKISASCVW